MISKPGARLAAVLAAAMLFVAGCGSASPEQETTSADATRATVAQLSEEVTVVADKSAQHLAAESATTFFDRAPAVFAIDQNDAQALKVVAEAAQAAQLPLLLLGDDNADTAAALEELGSTKVFLASELDEQARAQLGENDRQIIDVRSQGEGGTVELDQEALKKHLLREIPLLPETSAEPEQAKPVTALVERFGSANTSATTLAAVEDTPEAVAAAVNALTAGAQVFAYTGDPRGNEKLIDHAGEAEHVVALTTSSSQALASDLFATVATGVQLPGGSQLVFNKKRYVALYGSPLSAALGLLGEQGTAATINRAAEYAANYDGLFGKDAAVPALEIIVTVASAGAGTDGNYSEEWASEEFLPLVKAAEKAGQYVVLDFQPGRTPFVDQIKLYEDLLKYPHVGVALDPEWRIGPNERHLARIGHVEAAEVNEVIDYLADFTQQHRLPQKVLVLHQFQTQMLRDRDKFDLDRAELAVLIHADGQGTQGEKNATWANLHENAPEVYWGWKNFIDEDQPMLTPKQTAKIKPLPHFISYQ